MAGLSIKKIALSYVLALTVFNINAYFPYRTDNQNCENCDQKSRSGSRASSSTAPHLNYYGGPVISTVNVVSVIWGSDVNPEIVSMLPSFLNALVNSSWMDVLSQYSTVSVSKRCFGGTRQVITRGIYAGQIVITPSNTSKFLTDIDIQNELINQLDNNPDFPAPVYDSCGYPNTLYMIQFPRDITIDLYGYLSCQPGGFCAYHSTLDYYSTPVIYTVQADCASGCGSGTLIQNTQVVYSHELAEAVTDPLVGVAYFYMAPLAWYDPNYGEIGDICEGQTSTITVGGQTYSVEKIWSNAKNSCVSGVSTKKKTKVRGFYTCDPDQC